MRRHGGATALIAVLLGVAACSSPPMADEFRVGDSRREVLEAHGRPTREQTFTNDGQPIWGAIEEFWPRVPQGSTVLIWHYPVQGGTVELYFVDGSDRVQGTGFAPEGAVFEGSGAG